MRIIRHNGYIDSRKRRARWIAFLGFLMLTSTLWIALNPSMLIPAYIAMFIGFVIFNMGMQQVAKWSRNPRNDQFLDALQLHPHHRLPRTRVRDVDGGELHRLTLGERDDGLDLLHVCPPTTW